MRREVRAKSQKEPSAINSGIAADDRVGALGGKIGEMAREVKPAANAIHKRVQAGGA